MIAPLATVAPVAALRLLVAGLGSGSAQNVIHVDVVGLTRTALPSSAQVSKPATSAGAAIVRVVPAPHFAAPSPVRLSRIRFGEVSGVNRSAPAPPWAVKMPCTSTMTCADDVGAPPLNTAKPGPSVGSSTGVYAGV